jgi:hypothetical protein
MNTIQGVLTPLAVDIFRFEEHLYTRLRWLVGRFVGPSPTMRDYVEK